MGARSTADVSLEDLSWGLAQDVFNTFISIFIHIAPHTHFVPGKVLLLGPHPRQHGGWEEGYHWTLRTDAFRFGIWNHGIWKTKKIVFYFSSTSCNWLLELICLFVDEKEYLPYLMVFKKGNSTGSQKYENKASGHILIRSNKTNCNMFSETITNLFIRPKTYLNHNCLDCQQKPHISCFFPTP